MPEPKAQAREPSGALQVKGNGFRAGPVKFKGWAMLVYVVAFFWATWWRTPWPSKHPPPQSACTGQKAR